MESLKNQTCPACLKKELELTEDCKDVPYFGKIYLFSIQLLLINTIKYMIEK